MNTNRNATRPRDAWRTTTSGAEGQAPERAAILREGADVWVPGTSGGTASRPGDRPTRSLVAASVDGRDYLVGGRCLQDAPTSRKPRGTGEPPRQASFSGGIFCAVTGTNRVVSGHVLGDRLLMYDVPRIDKVVASMCLTCQV